MAVIFFQYVLFIKITFRIRPKSQERLVLEDLLEGIGSSVHLQYNSAQYVAQRN